MNPKPNFSSILYTDSPFLPPVTPKSLESIRHDAFVNFIPLSVAIAKEVTLEAIRQNEVQQEDFSWINETFKATPQNLYDFLIGFVTPPTLIVGGYTMKISSIEKVIKLYCPPTEDPHIIDHNRYKMRHLFNVYYLLESAVHRHPITVAKPVFDLCKTDVYKNDWYYLAGVHASETLFNRFSRQVILQ